MSRHGFVISGWIHTPFSVDVTVVGQIQAERASQLELSLCTDQMHCCTRKNICICLQQPSPLQFDLYIAR